MGRLSMLTARSARRTAGAAFSAAARATAAVAAPPSTGVGVSSIRRGPAPVNRSFIDRPTSSGLISGVSRSISSRVVLAVVTILLSSIALISWPARRCDWNVLSPSTAPRAPVRRFWSSRPISAWLGGERMASLMIAKASLSASRQRPSLAVTERLVTSAMLRARLSPMPALT